MGFLRQLYRATAVAAVFAYMIVELLVTRPRTRPQRAAWLSRLCRRVFRVVDLRVSHTGPLPSTGAIISNHLTYVDIIAHAALHPVVFVSKAELRKTPILGWMSMMAGTVYVRRGRGGSAAQAAEGMAKGFRDGLPVVFFPEGTTFVGDDTLSSFHTGLLAEALEARVAVHPAFIRYHLSPADMARGKSTRDDVHWGDQTLLAHLWNLFSLHHIQCVITFAGTPVAFSPEALEDRKIAAIEARNAVLQLMEPLPSAPMDAPR